MANETASEMRRKLLELQNELLKTSVESVPLTPAHQEPNKTGEASLNDIMTMLKELRANQNKIFSVLVEINNKLK